MLNSSEFRIANWVEFEGKHYQIDSISKTLPTLDTTEFGIGVVDWNNLKPITLTEEWLLKFGFELNGYASKKLDVIVYDFKGFRLKKFNGRMSKFFIEWGTGTRTYIAYVHKLQNVFYELNCEELEPKKA